MTFYLELKQLKHRRFSLYMLIFPISFGEILKFSQPKEDSLPFLFFFMNVCFLPLRKKLSHKLFEKIEP